MNCQEARQLFSPWLDGELPDEETRLLRAHLAVCRLCAEEVEKLQEITVTLRNMQVPVAPPEGFAAQVMERLRSEEAGGEAAELNEAVAAGKVVPLAGRKALAAGGGEGAGRGAAGGAGRLFARWRQGLRAGWRKSAAVAAALLMLLGGSAALAAKYLGGPGFFNSPAVSWEKTSLEKDRGDGIKDFQVTRDRQGDQEKQDNRHEEEPGAKPDNNALGDSLPGGGEEKPVPGAGEAVEGRRLLAGNSPAAPGASRQSPEAPAGEAGVSGGAEARPRSGDRSAASAKAVAGGEPKVFLNQPRAIESIFLRVRVSNLEDAARRLLADAGARGISSSVDHKVAAGDKAVEIFRFASPQGQADQFASSVTALGEVVERSRTTRDISREFAEKLDSYQKLIEERKTASGEEAGKLDAEIEKRKQELEAMDREAREQVILIVWLEQ